ncbi:MAG: hypothetical protein KIT48_04605 [Pseudolabrys sp.]|nr:hypothetical protein [Pseudolabrys sp.]
MSKTCPNCSRAFTGHSWQKFCCERCQVAAGKKRRAPVRPMIECPNCANQFLQNRTNKKFCSDRCAVAFHAKKKSRPATHIAVAPATPTKATDEMARLLADGFFLADLHNEIERIGKIKGIVAALEGALDDAIADDALWPVGKLARIALALALLNNPALTRHRWRHPHEQRRRPGDPRKSTGTALRARGIVGLRS